MRVRWRDTWIVLGCGPTASADYARARALYPQAPIATVNYGLKIEPEPDAYGTFESDPFWDVVNQIEFGRMCDYVEPELYTTRRNARRRADLRWTVVDAAFMGDSMGRDWKAFYSGTAENGWGMAAGLVMALCLVRRHKAKRIVLCGINGYGRSPDAAYDETIRSSAKYKPQHAAEIDANAARDWTDAMAAFPEVAWEFMTTPSYLESAVQT